MLPEEEVSAELYEVEKVCDVRQLNKGFQVLIKWSGYDDPEDNTWEPYTNLNEETCLFFLREYRQTLVRSASGKTLELKMQVLEKIIRLWKARMKKSGKHFNDSGELLRLIADKQEEDEEALPPAKLPAALLLATGLDDSDFRIKKKPKPQDPQAAAQPPSERIPDPTNTGEFLIGRSHLGGKKKKHKPSLQTLEQLGPQQALAAEPSLGSSPSRDSRPLPAAGRQPSTCSRHLLKIAEVLESPGFRQSVEAAASELRVESCEQLAKKTRAQDGMYVSSDASTSTADLRVQVWSAGQYLLLNAQDAIGRQVQAIGEKLRCLSEFQKLYSRLI